jgi:GntR family transcriptional regulator, transcriptional repressor for pyruvate dehydrogenase complex
MKTARRPTRARRAPRLQLVDGPTHDDLDAVVSALRKLAAGRRKLDSERKLALTLNVKRHQLRRALQRLRASGELAPAQAKRQPLVGTNGESLVRATNPMEVIEMRLAIEPALARLAALRASPFEIAAIEAAATTPNGTDSGAADLKFHRLIAASTRNKLAASLYNLLRQVARDARIRINVNAPPCPKRVLQRDSEHSAIAQAIARRDADAAERAMRLHLAEVQKRVLEQLHPLAVAG